jgi:hypothetical protein
MYFCPPQRNMTERTIHTSHRLKVFFSSILVFLLHLPFVFAKAKPLPAVSQSLHHTITSPITSLPILPAVGGINAMSVYDSLKLGEKGLAREAFVYGVQGWSKLIAQGRQFRRHLLSIVDFSKPSSQKRLFIIDLARVKLLFHTYVAHGMQSGLHYANEFSNAPESNKSSLGFYLTRTTYFGSNGYSLRLEGLERGVNDNAARRDIVMHGADYVNEDYIQSQGYIGRSWGCPAVAPKLSKPIIDKIKNGSLLFVYSPQQQYRRHSKLIQP